MGYYNFFLIHFFGLAVTGLGVGEVLLSPNLKIGLLTFTKVLYGWNYLFNGETAGWVFVFN